MVRYFAVAALVALVGVQSTRAQPVDDVNRKDLQVFKDVAATVDRYTQFTIFDDISAMVKDGVVTLTGDVKKADLPKVMQAVSALHPKKIENKATVKK